MMDSEFLKQVETWLGAIGLTIKGVIIAAVASFIAMRVWSGLDKTVDRWTTFGGGWALAAWGAEPLREWLELRPSIGVLVILLVGLFGMALTAETLKIIKITNWSALLKSSLDTILRRGVQPTPPPDVPKEKGE